jgi:hypothetical protein
MRRRTPAAAAFVACGLSLAVGAHAADPPKPELPRLNCTKRLTDPTGDAFLVPGAAPTATPGLDIESLFFRSTPEDIWVFLKLKDIPTPATMPAYDTAYQYTVNFKHGTTAFALVHAQVNPQFTALGYGAYPRSTPPNMGATGSVDPATDVVAMRLGRAAMEAKAAGLAVVDGGKFTDISVVTKWHGSVDGAAREEDALKPTGDAATWTVGDDYCFGAPPAALSEVSATPAQFGDVSTLSAKLLDEAGQPIANETVKFTVAGSPAAPLTATTDAAGVATVPYTVDAPAGTRVVTAAFDGTAAAGKATGTADLAVTTEVTKFLALAVKKTSTTARAVTATLRDDDGKAVGGQKVGWYVNNKLVATLVTDAGGKTVFKGAKAGQVVQARYAGLTGKYVASKSNAPKV